MRVSTGMLHESALSQLRVAWMHLQDLQAHISSGRRIHLPSDDPFATNRVLAIKSDLRAHTQYVRGIDEARQFAVSSEAAVQRLVDIAIEVQEIATMAADDSYGTDSLTALATQVDGLLEEALSMVNTQHADIRIFGGFQTRDDPFIADRDRDGRIVGITPRGEGTEGRVQRLVGDQLLLTINLTGTDLFGEGYDYLTHAAKIRDAALAGDQEAIRELLPTLEEDFDRINLALAFTGSTITRLDAMSEQVDRESLLLETARSEQEDLDMARALIDYQKEQVILEATLSTVANLMDLSLVNYL
jgi:flagellar hook-associated protein 3 FlgL